MFTTGFTNEMAVASKTGCFLDSRQIITQTRSNASTYGECLFDTLSGWIIGGSGMSVIPSNNPDPAIGKVLNLQTGSAVGSPCFVQRTYPNIPANFGMSFFPALVNVGPNPADALFVQIQKTANLKNLMMRFYGGGLYVFLNGSWTQLSSHSNTSWCEWWIEVAEAGGQDIITAYAGTQYVNSISGVLPNGPSTNPGLVYIGQESQATPNRQSQVAHFAIGATQLCDDMALTTVGHTLPFAAQSVSAGILVEDVSWPLILNTDITLEIGINNVYSTVPLIDKGVICQGVIDSTKPIRILVGTLQAPAAKQDVVSARVKAFNHKFIGLHQVGLLPTSTM